MSCITLAAAQYPLRRPISPATLNVTLNLLRRQQISRCSCWFSRAVAERLRARLRPELALTLDDHRLLPLSAAAQSRQMTIIVGAPLRSGPALHIAALIFHPNGALATYTKQHLHGAEQQYFAPGEGSSLLELHHHNIALAICADTSEPGHASAAARAGAHIYAAGVLVSEAGYAKDSIALADYARRYGMVTLMANHAAPTGGWIPAGRSAIWDNKESSRLPRRITPQV